MLSEDQCRAALLTALERESENFRQSGEETIHTGPFGDLPILIFSQDNHPSASEPRSKEDEIWDQMREESSKACRHAAGESSQRAVATTYRLTGLIY